MIKEFLIIATCVQGYTNGCEKSYDQYYQEQPALRERLDYFQRWTEEIAGKEMLRVYGPIFLLATGREGTIKLHRNWSITGTLNKQKLEYKYEW
jgi:hypothetical protein